MQEELQMVDPDEFENLDNNQTKVEENVQPEENLEVDPNAGVDLATPPVEDSAKADMPSSQKKITTDTDDDGTETVDQSINYGIDDEATVTKPIIRSKSSKYFIDETDKPQTVEGGELTKIGDLPGIVKKGEGKAGISGTEMISESEKDLQDQDRSITADELKNIWQQNKIPPAELTDDEWANTRYAYTVLYNPGNVQFDQQEREDARETLRQSISTINQLRQKKGVKISFDRDGSFQGTEKAVEAKKLGDDTLYNRQERYQKGRRQLYKLVKFVGKDIAEFGENDKTIIHQILMDKIVTGEFWRNLTETLNETNRAFALDLPNFAFNMLYYGGQAVYKGLSDPFKDISDFWQDTKSLRENSIKGWKEALTGGDPISFSDHVNDVIHQELKKQFDAGQIDQETYDRLTKIRDVNPTTGAVTRVRLRNIVPQEQALTFLNESLNQLSSTETFLLIAAENVLGMGGLGQLRKGRALSEAGRLKKVVDKEVLEQIKQGKFEYFGLSTLQAARKLKAEGINIKINESLMQTAMLINLNKTQMKDMIAGRNKLGSDLDALKQKLVRDGVDFNRNTEYLKLKSDYESVKNKILKNHFFGNTVPFFKESAQIALPASITQYAAVEFFGKGSGGEQGVLDFYTAQGLGAIVHFLGTIPIKGVSLGGLLLAGPRYLAQQAGPVKDAILDIGAVFRLPVDIFRSKDLEALDAIVAKNRNGKGLTLKERRGAEYIFKLASILPQERRTKIFEAIKEQVELEESIIKQFPAGERDEIRKLVQAPFAQASGLTWLMSASAMSGSGIDIRDLKSLVKVEEIQEISESKLAELQVLSRSLDLLKERLKGRTDIENPEIVEKFIDQYKSLYQKNIDDLIDQDTTFNANVVDIKSTIFLDTTKPIDSTIFNSLSRASINAKMKLNKELTEGEAIELDQKENFNLLTERAKLIASNKKSPTYLDESAQVLERIFEEHIRGFYLRGKLGYKDLDRLAKSQKKTIDVTELMFEFKEIADPLKSTGFGTFFSREGKFFDSTLNSQLYFSLNKMAVRTLSQLKGTTLRKLRQMARDPDSENFISKDADDMDIALYYHERGDLKAFKALPSQVTDLYAAFRDYAYRLDSGLPDDKKKFVALFKDKSNRILEIVQQQAPEYVNEFKKANANYKKEVFDRLDGGGPLTTYLKSKSVRETEMSKTGEAVFFQNVYKGKTPDKIIEEIIPKMDRYIRTGDESLRGDIRNFINEFKFQFSEFKEGTNKPIFNLDTEVGKAKFDGLKEAFSNYIYAKYANKFAEDYKKLDPRTKRQLQNKMGGYNFEILEEERLIELKRLFTVDVVEGGKDGKKVLLDIEQMIIDNKDIVKVMGENKTLRDAYSNFQKTGNAKIDLIKKGESAKAFRQRDFVLEEINKITGYKDNPLGFFTSYIENGSVQGIRSLKADILKKSQDLGNPIDEKTLDDAILYLTMQGAYAKGGLKVISSKKVRTFDGFYKPTKNFTNPQELFGALKNKNSQEILNESIGEDHTKFLQNITQLMVNKAEALQDVDRITGLTRPISDNELISRAFNLARGMVSPTYVGAEIAFRLASNAGIEMLGMAANNKEAARLMQKMFEFPEKITKVELSKFKTLAIDYVLSEFARQDLSIVDFFYDPTQQN